ncbi:hypothetical protein [Lysobacter humi (ex Lee et al. 2017)]
MRLLDAQLHRISLRDAAGCALLAALVCASSALFGWATGTGTTFAFELFPGVLLGCLMARAGISIVRSPLAAIALTPALVSLIAGSAFVADAVAGVVR